MLLFFMGRIKEVFDQGRGYAFPRPPVCLREGCKSSRIWGHGYVDAYFEGYPTVFYLKRYICADCGCVYKLRPFGYWPRHHVPVRIIWERLCHRVRNGQWGSQAFSRQRQGHWLRALGRNLKTYLGLSFGGLMEGFHALLQRGVVPVKRLL